MKNGTFKIKLIGPNIDREFEGTLELKGGEDSLPSIACAVLAGMAREESFQDAKLTSLEMKFTAD